jgi:hypothetical protein
MRRNEKFKRLWPLKHEARMKVACDMLTLLNSWEDTVKSYSLIYEIY